MICDRCKKNLYSGEGRKSITWNSSLSINLCNVCLEKEQTITGCWEIALNKCKIKELHYMSHKHNIPSILQSGIVCFNDVLRKDLARVRIDNKAVQLRRKARKTPAGMNLHDYAPLYFCTRTPMQWVITQKTVKRWNVVKAHDLVFIDVASIEALSSSGAYFTDGNAADSLTKFYNSFDDLDKLNWKSIYLNPKQFKLDDEEWQRQKSAEILVPGCIPPNMFIKLVCFSSKIKEELENDIRRVGLTLPVVMDSMMEYYFPNDLNEPMD